MIACQQGRELTEVAGEMEAELVTGSSLKAALDLNWDNPDERDLALGMVLKVLSDVEKHLESQTISNTEPVVSTTLETARQIEAQDVQINENGIASLRRGVAKNRRISIEDEEMRHGWKGKTAFIYL